MLLSPIARGGVNLPDNYVLIREGISISTDSTDPTNIYVTDSRFPNGSQIEIGQSGRIVNYSGFAEGVYVRQCFASDNFGEYPLYQRGSDGGAYVKFNIPNNNGLPLDKFAVVLIEFNKNPFA